MHVRLRFEDQFKRHAPRIHRTHACCIRAKIYLYACLGQLQTDGKCFPDDNIRVMTASECPLQLLHLPRREVRTHASSSSGPLQSMLFYFRFLVVRAGKKPCIDVTAWSTRVPSRFQRT